MSRCFGDVRNEPVFDDFTPINANDYVDVCTIGNKDITPDNYVKRKLKMLRRDMYIYPTEDEIDHLKELTSVTAIDNAVRTIISRYWG